VEVNHSQSEQLDRLRGEIAALRSRLSYVESRLRTNDLIGQATGVVMTVTGCDAEEAAGVIVRQSVREGRTPAEVAADITWRFKGVATN
jgi:AmiR/NasT family two-component response regulator